MSGLPPDASHPSEVQARERLAELTAAIVVEQGLRANQQAIVSKLGNRVRWRQLAAAYLRTVLWLRARISQEYQLASLLAAFFGSGALSFIVGATLGLSVLLFVGLWIVFAILSFMAYAHVLALPATAAVESRLERLRQAIAQTVQEQVAAESALAELTAGIARLNAEAEPLKVRLSEQTRKLQEVDWRALRGIYFERFLRQVFEHLGYEVQITKATGDQGVDLIVKIGERRIAIQAKGFAEKVDVFAVQEAYAGMAFYHCQGCAVITNATFTEAARALAKSVNCNLIDGSQIQALIDGQLEL